MYRVDERYPRVDRSFAAQRIAIGKDEHAIVRWR